ncbi:Copper amine oxidase N-terminal domain-containing protein [Paenibacillus sp. GP183]|nr:Copper amine oxidase N-terminal domain-containing protein [Paenibacillus sp. GP183]
MVEGLGFMKKKILLLVSLMLLIAGVVSASSIQGDYKGNPIVLIKSDGKALETDEVPGQIIDGHTMVPISTIRQLGVSVTWNASDYSVDVKLPQKNSVIDSYLKIANDAEMFRYIYFINDQIALANIVDGMLQNSTTQQNFKTVTDQANRLRVEVNNTWVNDLSKISYYSDDIGILNEINQIFKKLKDDLLNFDSSSASNETITMKSRLNILFNKYDNNLRNDESTAFDTVIKNYK